MTNQEQIKSLFSEYLDFVDFIVGLYCDTTSGFELAIKHVEESQKKSITEINGLINEGKDLDKLPFFYGKGDPNLKDSIILHTTTQGEFKSRNSKSGVNYKYIGNMCLITIYQYWEDNFRSKIAKILGKKPFMIKSDIFGDLKHIRHSIIHHNSIALKEVEGCKLLKWFKENDEIIIDESKFYYLMEQLRVLKFSVDNP